LDHLFVGVIEPIVFQRAFLQSHKQGFAVWAGEMKDFFHVDHLLHDFCLAHISWNPIEHESVDVRLEFVGVDGGVFRVTEDLHRRFGGRRVIDSDLALTAWESADCPLTQRELEILRLISNGADVNEIAAKLFISARTVDHHVSSVLAKLGAPTRGAAAAQAARLGLARAPGTQRPGQPSARMPP